MFVIIEALPENIAYEHYLMLKNLVK